MEIGKFNVVTDGAWGSCGKGAITTALAARHCPKYISTTNAANAGHTAVNLSGEKHVAKALPSAAILNKWLPNYRPTILVGASAAFQLDQMLKEIKECELSDEPWTNNQLFIHPRAGVITDEHRNAEKSGDKSTKHVASTMQGCATFLSDKVLRKPGLKLARDYEEIQRYVYSNDFIKSLHQKMGSGETILHEGSQGFSLDINHGSHYPACTSRGTTAVQNLADMGISPKFLGKVYLVIRPFPIRVGNIYEEGQMVGYSGDGYPDQSEITWEEVGKSAGMPDDEIEKFTTRELTTVTKRLRRVFEFSDQQLYEAALINGADEIALNFANYIDWSCAGCNNWQDLPKKVMLFIHRCQEVTGIPVTIVGTGPRICDICWRP